MSSGGISSSLDFGEALHSYLRDVETVLGLQKPQFVQALADWWNGRIDIFSLAVTTATVLAEKSALYLLYRLNDVLRSKGPLPRLYCSLNNDQDDFIAIVTSNGSRIHLLSQLSSHSSTSLFSTEALTDDDLNALASRLDQWTARWAIQLLHIELSLRYWEITARKRCMKVLHRLVRKFRVLPPCLFLRDVVQEGQHPVSGGGYADIFKGRLKSTQFGTEPVPVCLKALRVFQVYDTKERDKLLTEFCREAFLWTNLSHDNILPCFGVSTDVIENRLCLISPWMSNGNIMEFLKVNPRYDRLQAIIGIARGLSYLHGLAPQLVHGDIKGANVLVTEDGRCCLGDFGLCLMVETHTVGITATSSANKGTTRWLSPELLMPTDPKFHNPNKAARDIYAFACTVLEIYTGKPPFADQKIDAAVIFDVLQGKRPTRPNDMRMQFLDNIWRMMEECWVEHSYSRPQAKELVWRLEREYAIMVEDSFRPQVYPHPTINVNRLPTQHDREQSNINIHHDLDRHARPPRPSAPNMPPPQQQRQLDLLNMGMRMRSLQYIPDPTTLANIQANARRPEPIQHQNRNPLNGQSGSFVPPPPPGSPVGGDEETEYIPDPMTLANTQANARRPETIPHQNRNPLNGQSASVVSPLPPDYPVAGDEETEYIPDPMTLANTQANARRPEPISHQNLNPLNGQSSASVVRHFPPPAPGYPVAGGEETDYFPDPMTRARPQANARPEPTQHQNRNPLNGQPSASFPPPALGYPVAGDQFFSDLSIPMTWANAQANASWPEPIQRQNQNPQQSAMNQQPPHAELLPSLVNDSVWHSHAQLLPHPNRQMQPKMLGPQPLPPV